VNYYLVVTVSRNIKVDGVRDSYPTCFALARTCSTLSEILLDAPWSNLESESIYERPITPEWPSTTEGKSRNDGQYQSTEAKAVKEGKEERKDGSLTRKEVSRSNDCETDHKSD